MTDADCSAAEDIRVIIHFRTGRREQLLQPRRIGGEAILLRLQIRQVCFVFIQLSPRLLNFPLERLVFVRADVTPLERRRSPP